MLPSSELSTQPVADSGGGLVRLWMVLAYDGSAYHGWARQRGLPTVQAAVEVALATALRLPRVETIVAGRTDTGVHARGQVCHFDIPAAHVPSTLPTLLRSLNALTPPDIAVLQVEKAPAAFDARFAAIWRRYSYLVNDDPEHHDPTTRSYVLRTRSLDPTAMNAALAQLVGTHDFGAFCKARDVGTDIRRVLTARWQRPQGRPGHLRLDVTADAFCHSMVRSIVGASIEVGTGRQAPQWIAECLRIADRTVAVPVAPAHPLVLEQVGYPPPEQYAQRIREARAMRKPLPESEL